MIKVELGLEKLDLFLRTKKCGFSMKEKSDLFLWTERIGFLMNEKSNLFCDIKKKIRFVY